MGHKIWDSGSVTTAWNHPSVGHASRASIFFTKERMLQTGHPTDTHHAANLPAFEHTAYSHAGNQQFVDTDWRRIAATVSNQRPHSLKASTFRDQKGLIMVSLFFIFSGILITGISFANSLDETVSHSVFLVGAMIVFMGLSVFFLMLSFSFLCKHVPRDKAGEGRSARVRGHVNS